MKTLTKKTALLGLFTALALILSFLEALLPPLFTYAPGIKMGLPNIIIIFLLYRFDFKSAATVSFIRIFITALLFGSAISFIYSVAGATLSILVMYLLKHTDIFSMPVISIVGALCHNIAQILVASIILGTGFVYYLPVLSISALISGLIIGILATILIRLLKNLKV